MRVRNTTRAAPQADTPAAAPGASAAARAGKARAAPAPRAPIDVATVMGVPEAELTPKVRAALDRLMAEVGRLREGLEQARKRIGHLEELADRDALAPVMNRRAFVRELARMIAFAERYGVAGSVLYLDVDGMKQVNDTYGHAAGDAALQQVAEVLLGNIRKSDVVGRLGGDEFGVILAQAGPEEGAAKAAAVAAAIEAAPAEWRGAKLRLGVSYGVYTFAGGEQAADALEAADRAMYARKRASEAARR